MNYLCHGSNTVFRHKNSYAGTLTPAHTAPSLTLLSGLDDKLTDPQERTRRVRPSSDTEEAM